MDVIERNKPVDPAPHPAHPHAFVDIHNSLGCRCLAIVWLAFRLFFPFHFITAFFLVDNISTDMLVTAQAFSREPITLNVQSLGINRSASESFKSLIS